MFLDDKTLFNIKGGMSGKIYSFIAIGGGIITFIISVISGYINPKKCNNT